MDRTQSTTLVSFNIQQAVIDSRPDQGRRLGFDVSRVSDLTNFSGLAQLLYSYVFYLSTAYRFQCCYNYQQNSKFMAMAGVSHFENKINQAAELKKEGNAFFKLGNYDEASKKYQSALQLLEPSSFYGATESECHKLAEVSSNLLFNVGTCCFNQQKWKDAEVLYSEALTINPFYVKALFKRAMSKLQQENIEGAMQDVKKAYDLDKTNSDIHEGYERIRERYNEDIRKGLEKRKEMSAKIFSPTKKEKEKEKAKEGGGQNSWWLLTLAVPFAVAAIYQGVKYLKKS